MDRKITELTEIETITLSHYDQNANSFWEGTKDHDVVQNYEEFLAPFPEGKTLDILDFGCGPGSRCKIFSFIRAPGRRFGWKCRVLYDGSEIHNM